MNCPHCNQPIPDAAVVKAAASINGHRKRPGAIGLVRSPGRPKRKPKELKGIEHTWVYIDEASAIDGTIWEAVRDARPGSLKDNRKTIRNPWGIKGKPKEETK